MKTSSVAKSGLVIAATFALAACGEARDDASSPGPEVVAEQPPAEGYVRLYVVDRYEGVRRLDPNSLEVIDSIDTGPRPHGIVASPDGRWIYSTSMGDDLIVVIDPTTLDIARKIPMGGVPRPMALAADGNLAYVALSGMIGFVTLDLETDQVVDRLEYPIPDGTPLPPLDTYTHGVLLTPDQRELWVAAYATDIVYAFIMPGRDRLAAISVPGGPHWLTLNPDGEPLYVSLERSGQIAAIHRGVREGDPRGRRGTRSDAHTRVPYTHRVTGGRQP